MKQEQVRYGAFLDALHELMVTNGQSRRGLRRAVLGLDARGDASEISRWFSAKGRPDTLRATELINKIEKHYGLQRGHLTRLLPTLPTTKGRRGRIRGLTANQKLTAYRHIPRDFSDRTPDAQDMIVAWIHKNVLTTGGLPKEPTSVGRNAITSLVFPYAGHLHATSENWPMQQPAPRLHSRTLAPAQVVAEMADFLKARMQDLPAALYFRRGKWSADSAEIRLQQISSLFGSLVQNVYTLEHSTSDYISMALLALPEIWEWYLQWRTANRGFLTTWEEGICSLAMVMSEPNIGWLSQNSYLANRLRPIPGLLTTAQIVAAQTDWDGQCERLYNWAQVRRAHVRQSVRKRRDTVASIRVVLDEESPLRTYRRIPECIYEEYRSSPPRSQLRAELARSFLIIRLALHLGVRSRNLRDLLIVSKGGSRATDRELAAKRRGQLFYSEQRLAWNVLFVREAFKNGKARAFSIGRIEYELPDLGFLYEVLDDYVRNLRQILLAGREDNGSFFVASDDRRSSTPTYSAQSFYKNWIKIIINHGIYNPFTKMGAIPGLLPHGPHAVRNLLATHILKDSGSMLHASYALLVSQKTVRKCYGSHIPNARIAVASQILNRAWM